ncbi:hypothetical protein [Phocaeicola sp.]
MKFYKINIFISLLYSMGAFLSCSSGSNEIPSGNVGKKHAISVSMSVDAGTLTGSRGVDQNGYPEGNYPLAEVYLWAGNSAENSKVLAFPCSDGTVKLEITEVSATEIQVSSGKDSITFSISEKVRFMSQPKATISLPSSDTKTPAGKVTYGDIGDVLFVSSSTSYLYDRESNDFYYIYQRNKRWLSREGLPMVRYGAAFYLNLIVTCFDHPVVEGNTTTYSVAKEEWIDKLGNAPSLYKGRCFLSPFPLTYDLYNQISVGSAGVITLADNYISFTENSLSNINNTTGGTDVYIGYGAHSLEYKFFYPNSVIANPRIAVYDPYYAGVSTLGLNINIALTSNASTVCDIVLDYKELLNNGGENPMSRSVNFDNVGFNRIITPKKVFINGKLVEDNE